MTLGVPSSPGVPTGCTADTIVLNFNDVEALAAAFDDSSSQLAAIILEPVVGNMGCVPPEPGFLEACRKLCTKHGTVLIFDEVMTGFRVAYGGAQSRFGVTPDLTTLGKIIGGGMPVGAYGGRADIMDVVSPVGPVYQAGTLSGNPLSMACGIATLSILRDEDPYEQLESQTAKLCAGLSEAASSAGLTTTLNRVGSMFTLFFNPDRVVSMVESGRNDTKQFAAYHSGMLDRGVYLPCSQFEANFVSAAHTDADIEKTIAAARETLSSLTQN